MMRDSVERPAQYAAVDAMLTGRENLQLVGRLYHLGRAERRQRTVRLLEQVQLAGAAGRPVRTYSGGTRPRPCRRPGHRGRRPNDKNLAARPGREARALPGPAPVSRVRAADQAGPRHLGRPHRGGAPPGGHDQPGTVGSGSEPAGRR